MATGLILTPHQVRAVEDLTRLWPDRPFVLVGAMALSCFLDLPRETLDLDFSLSVSLDEYPAGLDGRPGWTRDPRIAHRWKHSGGVEVDVIPAGPALLALGTVSWPDGSKMSLAGFRLTFAHHVTLNVAREVSCKVATVPVLALLKMVAYLDRPAVRRDDLRDLAVVLDSFPVTDEERFSDEVLDRGLQYEQVTPYVLGRQLGAMTDPGEISSVRSFLAKLRDESDADGTQARMLAMAPASWNHEAGELLSRLDAFEAGLTP